LDSGYVAGSGLGREQDKGVEASPFQVATIVETSFHFARANSHLPDSRLCDHPAMRETRDGADSSSRVRCNRREPSTDDKSLKVGSDGSALRASAGTDFQHATKKGSGIFSVD